MSAPPGCGTPPSGWATAREFVHLASSRSATAATRCSGSPPSGRSRRASRTLRASHRSSTRAPRDRLLPLLRRCRLSPARRRASCSPPHEAATRMPTRAWSERTAGAARPLLPHARLAPDAEDALQDAAARLARAAALRGAQLAPLLALPDRHQRLPEGDRAPAEARAARRLRPAARPAGGPGEPLPRPAGSIPSPTPAWRTAAPRPSPATSGARASSSPSPRRSSTCRRGSARC